MVDAFLTAARGGDVQALLAILAPDVIARRRSWRCRRAAGDTRGRKIAKLAAAGGTRALQAALVNGAVGVVVAPQGRLMMVLHLTIAGGKIVATEAVSDPEPLRHIDLAIFSD